MQFKEIQLTHDAAGHCINSTQCFSPDDQWIVYDGRNYDHLIGSTGVIAMVNITSGEIVKLYETTNQTDFGPGVGAVTFSPVGDRILFIHGIRNADEERPYTITRRTGVAIDISNPGVALFMDARDIVPPFTNGALRGGTHAHTWSADGQWISFTYNDYILEQTAKTDPGVKDLRTIGIMIPGSRVSVPQNGLENNNGEMFSMLVVDVTSNPAPGSDEIEKAFDETWVGHNGYLKKDGSRQRRAIAYQGNLREPDGKLKTEIFIVDIPDDILQLASTAFLRGTLTERPSLPPGLAHRRIGFTKKGVSDQPRHWLRSNAEGSKIAFLAKNDEELVQLFTISPNGGEADQLTAFGFSIQGPINFSPDGNCIAYIADNSIFITDVRTSRSSRITTRADDDSRPVGAVNWSHDGQSLCYNKYVAINSERFLQIFLLKRCSEPA